MKTPILHFVKTYDRTRLHMPGHKGTGFLGCEAYDITEVSGADALYEANGIIAESEANAAGLFGTAATVYSTEGSSQCIRAMVHLAAGQIKEGRPWFLAARNAHKAFLYALALADADVQWLWPEEEGSLYSAPVTAQQVERELQRANTLPAAVYLTSPDYLGVEQPLEEIAAVCHRYGTMLLVDNAHGAYLHFLQKPRHPMDLGADICCDSAHKTLPVLTGGAYLHFAQRAAELIPVAKSAMALFGSTSPSYLVMASLDGCNSLLHNKFAAELEKTVQMVAEMKQILRENGWQVLETEPLKITIRCNGIHIARRLREQGVECEFAEGEHLVCMVSVRTTKNDLLKLVSVLGKNKQQSLLTAPTPFLRPRRVMTVRQAVYAPQETVSLSAALGRVCAAPAVSCPPAIPIAVSGELLDEQTLELFRYYGSQNVAVVKQ